MNQFVRFRVLFWSSFVYFIKIAKALICFGCQLSFEQNFTESMVVVFSWHIVNFQKNILIQNLTDLILVMNRPKHMKDFVSIAHHL